ncbi:MAG: DUF4139 domain-containing protein [Neptuniibacter sp.]
MLFQRIGPGIILVCFTTLTFASPLHIGSDKRQSVALTLYNQNLGLVRESRKLPPLESGQEITLKDVSKQLQVESLRIANAGQILEQNLNTNILNQQTLLEHYTGKKLQLARLNPATGQELISTVQLLSVDGKRALIKRDNLFETIPLNNQWRFIFPSLPQQLLAKPSLNFRSSGTNTPLSAQISYLTSGLNWNMDYVLTLSDTGEHVSLDGLASLTNQTGTDYKNAEIKLLAGELYQPNNRHQMRQKGMEVMSAMSADMAAAPREKLQDFHLYSLPRKTDLLNGQIKQVSLLSAKDITVERGYSYQFLIYPTVERNQHRVKPELTVKFKNEKKNRLGMPLPAGNLRTFSPDSNGHLQFIGGASINHTGEGDQVEVKLGKAFDLSIHRKQTHFSKTFNGFLVGQELRISNSRSTPAKLELTGNFPLKWEMKSSSHPHEKVMGGSVRWLIDVPAKGDAVLKFKVEMEKR